MTVTMGKASVEEKTRQNPDGTETRYRRVCVTLSNDGDDAVERKVTFYEVVRSGDGQVAAKRLCSSGPKEVPKKKRVVKATYTAEAPGTETFCCDVEGWEPQNSAGFGDVLLWSETGDPPKDKEKPIELGKGEDYKTVTLYPKTPR
jgi:hypothetical protein